MFRLQTVMAVRAFSVLVDELNGLKFAVMTAT